MARSGELKGYVIGNEGTVAAKEANHYKSFPTGVLCSDDSLLVAYRDGLSHAIGGSIDLVRGEGGTWGSPRLLYAKTSNADQWQYAGLTRRPSDNRIFLYSRKYGSRGGAVYVAYSDDDGAS